MCVYVSKSRYYFYEEIGFCLRILDNLKTSVDEKEKEKKSWRQTLPAFGYLALISSTYCRRVLLWFCHN
jgi:hypothetical protein